MFFLSGGYQKPVPLKDRHVNFSWWRHQMETFSALLAICAGKSLVTGEFPTQRPVTRSFDIFFDLRLNKRLRKQWWDWWFETPSRSSWRQCNVNSDRVAEGMRFQAFNPFSDERRREYVFFIDCFTLLLARHLADVSCYMGPSMPSGICMEIHTEIVQKRKKKPSHNKGTPRHPHVYL